MALLMLVIYANPTYSHFFTYDKVAYDAQHAKWEVVQPALSSLLIENPLDPSLLYDNGMVAYNQQKWAQAASYFEAVLDQKIISNNLATLAAIQAGNCRVALHELDKALQLYTKALEIEPGNKHAQHNKDVVTQMLNKENQDKPQNDEQNKSEGDTSDNADGQDKQNKDQDDQNKNEKPSSDNQNNLKEQNNQKEQNNNSSDQKENSQSCGTNQDNKSKSDNHNNSDEQSSQQNPQSSLDEKKNNDSQSTSQQRGNSQESLTNNRKGSSGEKKDASNRNKAQMNHAGNSHQEQKRDAQHNTQEPLQENKQGNEQQEKDNHISPIDKKNSNNNQDMPTPSKNQSELTTNRISQSNNEQHPPLTKDPWIQYILQKQEEKDQALNKKMIEARVAGTTGEQDGLHNW